MLNDEGRVICGRKKVGYWADPYPDDPCKKPVYRDDVDGCDHHLTEEERELIAAKHRARFG